MEALLMGCSTSRDITPRLQVASPPFHNSSLPVASQLSATPNVTSTSIMHIPEELLCLLFEYARNDDVKSLGTITAVCKLWRTAAISHPKLWSVIHCRIGNAGARLFIQRSKQSRLNVIINQRLGHLPTTGSDGLNNWNGLTTFCQILGGTSVPTWESLSISTPFCTTCFLANTAITDLSQLEWIDFHPHDFHCTGKQIPVFPAIVRYQVTLPVLTPGRTRHIRILSLVAHSSSRTKPTFSDLTRMLLDIPLLEELYISGQVCDTTSPENKTHHPHTQSASPPQHLRRLSLNKTTIELFGYLASALFNAATPSPLYDLSFDFDEAEPHIASDAGYLCRFHQVSENLQRLRLVYGPSGGEVASMISHLPHLRELVCERIVGSDALLQAILTTSCGARPYEVALFDCAGVDESSLNVARRSWGASQMGGYVPKVVITRSGPDTVGQNKVLLPGQWRPGVERRREWWQL